MKQNGTKKAQRPKQNFEKLEDQNKTLAFKKEKCRIFIYNNSYEEKYSISFNCFYSKSEDD